MQPLQRLRGLSVVGLRDLSEPTRKSVVELLVVVLSMLALLLRFWRVDSIPFGFYSDESVALANSVCLRHTGIDLWGHSWSLFSGGPINDAGYTVSAPGHLFILYSLWLSLFGDTIAAARSFEVFISLIIVAATVGIAHNFLGRRGAIWALGLSAISPWTWTLSRVAFVTPNFLTMHLFVGLWIITRHVRHRAGPTTTEIVIGGLLFGMAASRYYSALSTILVAGAFIIHFFLKKQHIRTPITFSGIIIGTFVVMQTGLSSHTRNRISQMPISSELRSEPTIVGKIRILIRVTGDNLLQHLSPDFLVFRGDRNLRHHSGWGGQFSWSQILLFALLPGLILTLWRRTSRMENDARLAIIASLGALGGLVTSSATGEQLNANRALVSAPFLVLLCVVVGVVLAPRIEFLSVVVLGLGLTYFGLFANDYFTNYQSRSSGYFQKQIRIAGEVAQKTNDFDAFERRLTESAKKLGVVATVGLVFYEAANSGKGCPGYDSDR
jgi:hypothetical protein